MAGAPKRTIAALFLLLLLGHPGGPSLATQDGAEDEAEPVLLGPMSREQIERELPDWVVATVEAMPDVEVASALPTALTGAEVIVYFGSWCSDSARELPRLWRALDEAGGLDPAEIRYIGIGRNKEEPADWLEGVELRLVPTFVVRRAGHEVGRIVETSPNGIERDLLSLLLGERTGVLSASDAAGTHPEGG